MEHSEALVTSVHHYYGESNPSGEVGKTRIDLRYTPSREVRKTRIGLRWEGKHEIDDFELERLGNILTDETETEHTGWVEVEYPGKAKTGDVIPLRKSP